MATISLGHSTLKPQFESYMYMYVSGEKKNRMPSQCEMFVATLQ